MVLEECAPELLGAALARLGAAEIVMPEGWEGEPPGPGERVERPRGDFSSDAGAGRLKTIHRSEEHTSELQSLMRISYAVFCLKKKTTTTHITRPEIS